MRWKTKWPWFRSVLFYCSLLSYDLVSVLAVKISPVARGFFFFIDGLIDCPLQTQIQVYVCEMLDFLEPLHKNSQIFVIFFNLHDSVLPLSL